MPNNNLPPWADAVASRYERTHETLVLADLGQCRPATALSDRLRGGTWKLMPYALTDGTSGRMVWASGESRAPELRLPMAAEGLHAIFLGLFSGGIASEVLLRLEDERIPQLRATGPGLAWNQVEEVFYRIAALDGQALCLVPGALGCGVAYLKLIPLSEREGSAFLAERKRPKTRAQAATYDGLGILYNRSSIDTSAKALLSSLEGFRDTGFGTLLLQYGGADQVPYPSRIANRFGAYADPEAYPENPGHRRFAEAFAAFAEQGINPYRVLVEGAHQLGMDVQVSVRPALWTFWEPYVDFFESPFYREHPEWRTIDRDGTPVARMSWAVPQVRQHLIRVVEEAVQLGADGANVLFNRGMPVVLYEPAFVELFQRRYGDDPHALEESDPRITEARYEVIAAFLRELRTMLETEQGRRGTRRPLVLSVSCFGNEGDNLHFGLDLRRLVEAGLVDEVYPYKWDHLQPGGRREWDIGYFSAFCRPRGVRVSPILTAGYEFETQVEDGLRFYAQGVDSVSYWDLSGMWRDMRQWTVMSRMDQVEELQARQARGPALARVCAQLRLLNGQVLDGRYPPYMGG